MNLISITGPESTGKSSLAQALAKHYNTQWVKEFAREYLEGLDRPYEFNDIARIAKGQLNNEKQLVNQAKKYLFCDTDMLVCKIWSDFKFGKTDPWLEMITSKHKYDLYLLCGIDLPWEEDPLREHPDRRKELFDLYLYEIKRMGVKFQIVTGSGMERVSNAISIIDNTFINQSSDH